MHIQTVLGPIAPEDLGVTLTHEHLLVDCSAVWTDPTGESWIGPMLAGGPGAPSLHDLVHGPVKMEHLGELLRSPLVSLDNTRLDDVPTAIDEAKRFAAVGGSGIVELSNVGLKRNPLGLKQIAEATGLHVIMGSGYYVDVSHPPELASRSEEEIAQEIVRDVQEGVDGTGIKAGIIGEIGTGNPMTPSEARSLRAAAIAQQATGVALNIHVSSGAGVEALDLALAQGVSPDRIAISHVDCWSGMEYMLAVAERGVYLSFDSFGDYWWWGARMFMDDGTRVEHLLRLVERGYLDRIVLSSDICTKIQTTKYGGLGYAHISRFVEPMLRERGLSDADVRTLRVENPRRLLSTPD